MQLFRDTKESFPVPFIAGDVFEESFLSSTEPGPSARPALDSVKTLTELKGHVSAIHASSFFHLFGEELQSKLAHQMAGLISRQPGSIIFGVHGGLPTPGFRNAQRGNWAHSPESWTELWEGILGKDKCKVTASLVEHSRALERGGWGAQPDPTAGPGYHYVLQWCVEIL